MSSKPPTAPNVTNELARERNRAAAERTLLAWIRTALSMIVFGIGFGAAGNYLGENAPEPTKIHDLEWVGSAFILLAVVSLIAALIQNVRLLRRLRATEFVYFEPVPMGLITAGLLVLLGLLGLVWVNLV